MYQQANAFVQKLAQHFNASDFAALAEGYVFPLPVQVDGELLVLHSAAEMVIAIAQYRAVNVAAGLVPSAPRIVAIDLPRNGRFRLWLDWHYGAPDATRQEVTRNVYYCSTIGNRIQVEMVHFLRVAAPGQMADLIQRQRIA
jgi:hypothetical protein